MSIARRVVARFIAGGYYGWDPPDDEDELEAPREEWDDVIDVFPAKLQKRIGKPEEDRDQRSHEQSVTLTGGVDLSDDYTLEAAIYIEVSAVAGTDADEDGEFGFHNESTSYELSVGSKTWSGKGHGYSKSKLQRDFREWSKACHAANAEAAEELDLPRS